MPKERICPACGKPFVNKNTKYCSGKCYHSNPVPEHVRRIISERKKKHPDRACLQCKKMFVAETAKRMYCSYPCFIASGGAFRAGMAAQMAKSAYGVKKDANHSSVVLAAKQEGASVVDTAHLGGGFPDLIIGYNGHTLLVEVKNLKTTYGRRGLNKNQQEWRDQWKGGPYVVVSDAAGLLTALRTLAAS